MLVSTRGGHTATASEAILRGIAPDGGLYAPDSFVRLSLDEIMRLAPLPYARRAGHILSLLLDDYTEEEIETATQAAYGSRFEAEDPAPLRRVSGNTSLLELFHGPTLAFKDMALQLLPHLLGMAAQKNGIADEICILVATSGDTGKAALEGFSGVPGTRCVVFYPKNGVSHAQYLQMATQRGENAHVIAVEGNFDDAQTGVKQIFADAALGDVLHAQGRILTSANSINYGRLAPQVAYYFSAYVDMVSAGAVAAGDPVNFVVPTGNFGNILAAVYAREMGLPVGRLICASNANRVLADFIHTGAYDINRSFHKTASPSMDILISSNLERYLFELSGHDADKVRGWMSALLADKRYTIDKEMHAKLTSQMLGGWVSDEEAFSAIQQFWRERKVLIDPHTAVAAALLLRYREESADKTPSVIVATASPFKFGRAVAKALGANERDETRCCEAIARNTGIRVPESILALERMDIRHTQTCTPDSMADALLNVFPASHAAS